MLWAPLGAFSGAIVRDSMASLGLALGPFRGNVQDSGACVSLRSRPFRGVVCDSRVCLGYVGGPSRHGGMPWPYPEAFLTACGHSIT